MKATASSFADAQDIADYKRTKSLAKGDNAVGCWGDPTHLGTGPSCALHRSILQGKFGPQWKKIAKHKKIRVRYKHHEVICVLKDICGKADRIDLNPDAVKAIGLRPPILVPVEWEWLVQSGVADQKAQHPKSQA